MEETDVSTLYSAATEALVSETSATSTFEKMISVAYSHSTPETFEKEVKETEKIIKKEFDIGAMPGSWRSAKAVIQGAMKLGIGLIDDNGKYCGKTYLQSKIKEMKIDRKEPMTDEKYAQKVIDLLIKIPDDIDGTRVYTLVKDFLYGK